MADAAPDYDIRIHRSFETFPREVWDRLFARCPDASVFQQYGWVAAWWHTCAPVGAELCIVTAEQNGEVHAIAPLYLQRPTGDSERGQLRFLGGFHNDYQAYLVEADHLSVYGDLHRHVRLHLPVDEIVLNEVPRASTLNRWLALRSHRAVAFDPTPCPMLRFDIEDDIDAYVDKRTLRRKQNRLNGIGQIAVEHLTDGHAIRSALPDLFVQHRRRWEGTDHPSLFRHEQNRAFYQQVVEWLPEGTAVFTRLRLDERTIACHLGFHSGPDLLWYKPAFDMDFAKYSPGEMMLSALIRHAHATGCRALDFTRGDEAFKQRFSNTLNWNDNYILYRSAARYAMRSAERAMRRSYRRMREAALRSTPLQRERRS